eukprot:CAMPEP_0172425960 /NCGR_PEP_ID=MMETSP1064-20121228/35094_1 /TAXON_ID=202472 /ORGANISM="Aulacoseira subarctica , Strain CCAP 1002/5" /LENGTH=249 /DNA_ID=CAMNT_0013169275 /DNA_START=75 /DNA_END=824 /DNA_ORIENTATION=+
MTTKRIFVNFAANIIVLISFFACITAESNSSCLTETLALFKDSGKSTLSGAYESYFSNFSTLCELQKMSKVCNFTSLSDTLGKATSAVSGATSAVSGAASAISGIFGTGGGRRLLTFDSALNSLKDTVTNYTTEGLQGLTKGLTYNGVIDLSSTDIGTVKDACTNAAGKMCYATVNTNVTGTYSLLPMSISFTTVGLPVCLASSCKEADLIAVFGPVIDSQMAYINSTLASLNIKSGTFTYTYLNGTCT